MGNYRATVIWRRREGDDFPRGRYSRAHEWHFDEGVRVPASASPSHVRVPFSDPAAVDPEEAYIAALSSCHMLFFLYLAGKAGLDVTSYEDEAVGEMAKSENGREWIARVTLRPEVTFAEGRSPSRADLERLHHEAHELCYVANSVKTEVVVEIAS